MSTRLSTMRVPVIAAIGVFSALTIANVAHAQSSRPHEQWRVPGAQQRAIEGTRNAPSSRETSTPSSTNVESSGQYGQQQLVAEAIAANDEGIKFANEGDWEQALERFQKAANKCPADENIRKNLAIATARVKERAAERNRLEAEKAATQSAKHALSQFVESLRASQPSTGLDFDGLHPAPSKPVRNQPPAVLEFGDPTVVHRGKAAKRDASPSGLEFGDPRVVDARRVPSGVPKGVDEAIAGVYSKAPPGVADRVRKAFQAAQTKDWKVARAWLQDALLLDPENAGIKQLLSCIDEEPKRRAEKAGSVLQEELDNLADLMGEIMWDTYIRNIR